MQYPTYGVEVSNFHLRSRKQLVGPSSLQITELEDEEPIEEALDKQPLEIELNQELQTTCRDFLFSSINVLLAFNILPGLIFDCLEISCTKDRSRLGITGKHCWGNKVWNI
jgi:hypothetical protein